MFTTKKEFNVLISTDLNKNFKPRNRIERSNHRNNIYFVDDPCAKLGKGIWPDYISFKTAVKDEALIVIAVCAVSDVVTHWDDITEFVTKQAKSVKEILKKKFSKKTQEDTEDSNE